MSIKVLYDERLMRVTVDDDAVRAALGDLESKTPAVLKVAVNATAREARRLMLQTAYKRYDVNAKGKEKLQTLKQYGKATNANTVAEIGVRGRMGTLRNDLGYFRTYPREPLTGAQWKKAPQAGFRARVLKSSPMKTFGGGGNLSKGFLVQFSTGHIGMVERDTTRKSVHTETKRGHKRWRNKQGNVDIVQTLGSPSAKNMHRVVWEMVEQDVEIILQDRVERRIQQVLAKAGRV